VTGIEAEGANPNTDTDTDTDTDTNANANMAEIGVFAKIFPVGPPEQVAGAIRAAGFTAAQLNLAALGRATLDVTLTRDDAVLISAAFRGAGVHVWGVSGTFNAIGPDVAAREHAVAACIHVIEHASELGAQVVTLCTGTRDPDDMWRAHPDNTTQQAWSDLRDTLDQLIPHAARAGVQLGIEPEEGNVVRDARTAVRLLAELGGDARHLTIVLDPANLLTVGTLDRQRDILTEAFDLLGAHTAAVHAKDVVSQGYAAPGVGGMDYDLVMRLHRALPQPVPIIAQDLTSDDARRVRDFLAGHADRARSAREA
jgi:sugar phosphate isomerase/epimerase